MAEKPERTPLRPTPPRHAPKAPAPADTLPPDVVVTRLRAIREQLPDLHVLTAQQRRVLTRLRAHPSNAGMQVTIAMLSDSEASQIAVGQTEEDVRRWLENADEWTAVEGELRGMLRGVTDANLMRFQRASEVTARVYNICQQLARDPAHAHLRPYLDEILRLRNIARRKKSRQAPESTDEAESTEP